MGGENPGPNPAKQILQVQLSPDGLACTLDLSPPAPGEAPPDLERVREAVLQAGVQPAFFREDTASHALNLLGSTGAPQRGVLVAVGEAPRPASGWTARPCGTWEGRFVLPGDKLVELVAESPAKPGQALDGTPLPAPPDEDAPKLIAGPFTALSPQGDLLVSVSFGTPVLDQFTCSVKPGLQISQDKLTCRMHLLPQHVSGRQPSIRDATQWLSEAGILPECVLEESLKEAFHTLWTHRLPLENLLVAQGRVPVPARAGTLYLPTRDPLQAVFPGQEVARRTPSVEAVNGMDLFGQELMEESQTMEAEMEAGPNTRYDPDEDDRLLATAYGKLLQEGTRVSVEPALRIDPGSQCVHLDVFPATSEGRPMTMDRLVALLEETGVHPDCLHLETLRLALAKSVKNQEVIQDVQVGAAISPDPGTRGAFLLEVSAEAILRPGDVIGRFHGARSPRDGRYVLGGPLPPQGEPAFPLSPGDGVTLDTDHATLTARVHGYAHKEDGLLHVVPCVQVSLDLLTATLVLPAAWADGELLCEPDILALLEERGVQEDTRLPEAWQGALRTDAAPRRVCVAMGTPPTPGQPGHLQAPPHLSDGCALPGDVLLQLAGATAPLPGRSVLGDPIPPPELEAGHTLEIQGPGIVEEGQRVVSNVVGFAHRQGAEIVLEEALRFSADGLRCTMDLHHRRVDGSQLDVDDVVEVLIQQEVQRERIEPDAIALALRQSQETNTVQPGVLVAMGRPPQGSKDWTICLPDDHPNRAVMVSDTVAWRGARVPSKAGVGVRGEKILAPSNKDRPKLRAGENCTLDPRGNFITSEAFGKIVAKENKFSVEPALQVDALEISARMDVFPRRVDGRALSVEDLLRVLRSTGIESRFIQEDTLRSAVSLSWEQQTPQWGIEVAKSEPPAAGQDGQVEPFADPKLACVFPGDPAARLLPPVPPTEGVNLYGQPCFSKVEGLEIEMHAEESVSIEEDTAVAEIYGQVRIKGSVVSIRPGFHWDEEGLLLEVDLFPTRGSSPVILQDLKELILSKGVSSGRLEMKSLAEAQGVVSERNQPREKVVAARSIPPEPGTHGSVVLLGSQAGGVVFEGDEVARLEGFSQPSAGQNIFGQEIDPPEFDSFIPMGVGDGLVLIEDGLLVTSKTYGVPHIVDRRVEISPGIHFSADGLICTMDFVSHHLNGRPVAARLYLEALEKAGVSRERIDAEALAQAVKAAADGFSPVQLGVPVALGVPPKAADPGKPTPVGLLEMGCVFAGDSLAEFTAGDPPRMGQSVLGEEIPPTPNSQPGSFQTEGPILLEAGGRAAKAAEYGFATLQGASLVLQSGIHISADSMRCTMDITHRRTDGSEVTAPQLESALRQAGIAGDRIGVEALIRALARARESGEIQLGVEAAKGTPPRQGEDWEITSDGMTENRCAFVGDTLLERRAKSPARSGLTVRGDRLVAPANPNRPRLRSGAGARRSSRGGVVLATSYGVLHLQGDKASVQPGLRFLENNLVCHMDIYPQRLGGGNFTSTDLVEVLLNAGVLAEFIDENAIEEALSRSRETQNPIHNVLVAKGTPVFEGKDGCPSLLTRDPTRCALPGEVFAWLSEPEPPRAGVSVLGEILSTEAVVEEGLLEAGEFARFSDSEDLSVEARTLGFPTCEGSKVDIQPASEFAESGRACHLDLAPFRLDGDPLKADDVVEALVKDGVLKERIDTEGISRALATAQKKGEIVRHVLVAMAIDPFPAYPGRLEVVEAPPNAAFFPKEVLARIVDEEPEELGVGVRGEEIRSDESIEPLNVQVGPGCSSSEEGRTFRAVHYGRPILDGTFLDIRPGVQVAEDGSECRLDVLPKRADGSEMGLTDLLSVLRSNGLEESLIDQEAIQLALDESLHSPQFGVLVARWTPPDNGEAGQVVAEEFEGLAFLPGDPMATVSGGRAPAPGQSVLGDPALPESPAEAICLTGEGPVLLNETAQSAKAGAYGGGRVEANKVVLEPGIRIESMEVQMDVFSRRVTGEPLEIDDLVGVLTESGVVKEHVDLQALQAALLKAKKVGVQRNVCVAVGVAPSRESSWHIEQLGVLEGACVLPGDQIVACRLEDQSQPGCTVLGEAIPPPRPPRPPSLSTSDGCALEQRNRVVVATSYGEPSLKGLTVRVRPGIQVSADGLSCNLDIFPRRTSDEAVTEFLLRSVLTQAGIAESCVEAQALQEGMQRAWQEQAPQRSVRVAAGTPPDPGEDGRVVLATHDASACVLPGDPVAKLLPPVDPKEGLDVRGMPIPTEAEVEAGAMEAGEHVLYSTEDESLLVSKLYGQPFVDGSRGSVHEGLRVDETGLQVEMDIFPRRTNGAKVTEEDLASLLHETGIHAPLVQWDLVNSSLKTALETGRPVRNLIVAKAEESQVGFGGHLDPIGGVAAGTVLRGDPVAKRVGTVAPLPGIDVVGNTLEPPPTPPSVADSMDGCDLHEDGITFLAAFYGTVRKSGPFLKVEPGLQASADGQTCEMDIHPERPSGRPLSMDDLLGALIEAGIHPDRVVHSSLEEGLAKAKKLGEIQTVLAARGIPPQSHRQGEWKVESLGLGCVLPGMVLASRSEETPGRDGVSIQGDPVQASNPLPADTLQPRGGCQWNEARTEIIATSYGFAQQDEHHLEVESGVHVTHKDMRCSLDISPLDFLGKPIRIDQLLLALTTAGIDPAAIRSDSLQAGLTTALESNEIQLGVRAAEGTPPVQSKDWQVDAIGSTRHPCAFPGDVVAQLGATTPARSGRNVLGVRVLARANPNRPTLRAGPGCSVTARGRMAVAVLYGEPFLDGGQVRIQPGIRHSEDRLFLSMDIFPRHLDGRAVTEPDLLTVLKQAEVPLDKLDLHALRNAMARAWSEDAPQRNVRIASGVLPRAPQDGRIVPIGDPATTGAMPEQVVARVLPPVPGTSGWTLDGMEILAEGEGETLQMEAGEGVHIGPSEEAQAEWYGNVSIDGSTVTVTPGLRFDESGLECVMDIYPEQGPDTPTELRNLLGVLKQAGVSPDRIDTVTLEASLETALATGQPQLNVPVALSMEPCPGEPGILVALGPSRQTVAFPGDVVVRLEGSRDPTPGINVMGDETPPPPDAWAEGMTAREHCIVRGDGTEVEASRYGRVDINQRSVGVVPGVTVSEDRLACFVDVAPSRPDGRPVLLDDLVAMLEGEGIARDLMDLDALSVALQAASSGLNPNQERICAARGTLPREGVQGRIAVVDGIEDGCVLPGDVFLHVVDEVAPAPGRDVYGAAIAPPPAPAPPAVAAGDGARLSQGGREVRAAVFGRARWDGTTASVDAGLRFVDENMRCLVEMTRNRFDGSPLKLDQLLAALVESGVDPSCINEAALTAKLQTIGERSLRVWAAQGVASETGANARLESLPFLKSGFLRPGDIFLQRIPIVPMVPGRTVTGETLVPKKKLRNLEIVETTACTVHQDTVQSETYGGASVELVEAEEHEEGPVKQTHKMRVAIRPGVVVSKDEMSVSMDIYPCHADGTPTSADALLSVLKGLGIDESTLDLHALDSSIEEAISSGKRQKRVTIAHGIPPRHGEPGWLRLVDLNAPANQVEIARSGGLLVVFSGDPVLTVEPPTQARHGRTVTGRTLPALPGEPASLVVGSGIQMRGYTAIARRDGVILSRRGLLDVVPLHVVDSPTQRTRVSDGSLDVRIPVPEDGRITAPGDIWVHGDVHCHEISAGGNIIVLGRLLGREDQHLRVRAGGAVIAQGAEHVEIHARGDVRLNQGAVQCHIETDGQLWMDGDPGALVGGESRVRTGAVIRVLGDGEETPTVLIIGGHDRGSETLRLELERRRLALEMPNDASIDPEELKRTCATLEEKLASSLEHERVQPPCFALVWSQAHRGSSVSTEGAAMGLGSKSLEAGVFHVSAETGDMVHTLLSEFGVEASLEASVEAIEEALRARREEAAAKAALDSQATEDESEPIES